MTSAVQNLNAVLAQFGVAVQIGVPPDLNQRAENLKETCPELLEAGEQWPARIDTAVANWEDIKENMGQLNSWLSTAESEFNSIQSIPKFLTDFPALEDRFQVCIVYNITRYVNIYPPLLFHTAISTVFYVLQRHTLI